MLMTISFTSPPGEVVSNVSHMDWEDFIRTRILDKMGMKESLSRFSSLRTAANIATGHLRLPDGVIPVDPLSRPGDRRRGRPRRGHLQQRNGYGQMAPRTAGLRPDAKRTAADPSAATHDLWKVVTPVNIGLVPVELAPAQMDFCGYAPGDADF